MSAFSPAPLVREIAEPPALGCPSFPRRAGFEDLHELMVLESICFEDSRRDSRAVLRRSLRHPFHEIWVIEKGDSGFAAALVLRPAGQTMRLHSLATHPDFRGLGMGGRLLAFTESRAIESGLKRVTLETAIDRPDLLGWYERHGYRRIRRLPGYYGSGRDAWRLHRILDPCPES